MEHPLQRKKLKTSYKISIKPIGLSLTNEKCFSAHDVIEGVNVSSALDIKEEEFELISGYIILQLLDKHCIKNDEHDHGHGHNNTDLPKVDFFIGELFEEFGDSNNGSEISHENFEKMYEKLKLGSGNHSSTTTNTGDGDGDHSGHNHRRRKRRALESEENHEEFKKCYSAEQILKIYDIEEGKTISQSKFKEICPSLIQQLESGVCETKTASNNSTTKIVPHADKEESWKPWIGSVIAILVVSLASLSGVLTKPVSNKKWFQLLLITLMAMAVSVMIGDAVLHLFPHALNLHNHEEGDSHDHGEGNPLLKKDSYIWKSLLLLLGLYLFLMFEMIMHAVGGGHSHHTHVQPVNTVIGNSKAKGAIQMSENNSVICAGPNGIHDCQDNNDSRTYNKNGSHESLPDKFDYAPTPADNAQKKLGIRDFESVVWMILIGDGIHNFLDGVAIGVAFADDTLGGVSTSIAVLCHELPHELGDFAVLLNSGLSMRQALSMNFISSLASFIGGFIGVALGTEWQASPWIFSITAGLFIYIALVDMLPEILHSSSLKKRTGLTIGLVNVGLFSGFVLMFLLAAYEDDIKNSLKSDGH